MQLKFQIISAREIASKKKYVVYNIKICKDGLESDSNAIFIERRYTDFLELYNTLCQGFPGIKSKVAFPRKLIIGNFSPEVIKSRILSLESFLKVISESNVLIDSSGFRLFLTGHEDKLAKRFLTAKKFFLAKPFLEKSFKILNKILTEHHPSVILALCRLAACCTAEPLFLEDASKYAELALRRFDGISDVDLLYHYVPLLQMCVQLWGILGKDKEDLELRLSTLKRLGHRVEGCPSLLDSVLAVE